MKKLLLLLTILGFTAALISSCSSSKLGCPSTYTYSKKPFNK